ncbi:MAG: heme exporter protein CcmD [Burkholderiales bacterium]
MNWASWNDFVAMGGYGLYVWGSYGVTLALMVTELVLLALRKRNVLGYLRSSVTRETP